MWKGDPETLAAPQVGAVLHPVPQPSGGEFPGSGSDAWARWPPNQTPTSDPATASKVRLIRTLLSPQFLRQVVAGMWVME